MQKSITSPFAAHNYLALVDPEGNIVLEVHGIFSEHFSMLPETGNDLQVAVFKRNGWMEDHSVTSAKPVLSGSEEDMKSALQHAAENVAAELADKGMLYSGLGANSNSVWNTMLKELGIRNTAPYGGPINDPGSTIDLRQEPSNDSDASPGDKVGANGWIHVAAINRSVSPDMYRAMKGIERHMDGGGDVHVSAYVRHVGDHDVTVHDYSRARPRRA